MQFIFGGKREGKTTWLLQHHKPQTYNFWVSDTEQSDFTTISLSNVSKLRSILGSMKKYVGDVLPHQDKLSDLSPEMQKEVIQQIETGKKKFPACRIACFDKEVKEAYALAGVKYDGTVLMNYTVSLIIDDIDKKAPLLDIDSLIELIFDKDEFHISEVMVSQTSIKTRFLSSVQSMVKSFVFLRGCDREGFMELYRQVIVKQDEGIEQTYRALQKYQTLDFGFDQRVQFLVVV